ncbi:hypothetical protein HDU84_006265 [Entophlyctis sp. JEL0112]|nr:hypothetical protein HDU84_006265 [Entophlyctis sp. JEL0112]
MANCTSSTPDSNSICSKCDETGKIVSKLLYISRGEANFASRAVENERLSMVPMILFACPICRTLEFPGFQNSLINLLDILANESAQQLLTINHQRFKHRDQRCPGESTTILAHIEKDEVKNLAQYVIKTLAQVGPASTQLSPLEFLVNIVDDLDELRFNPGDDNASDSSVEEINESVRVIQNDSEFHDVVANGRRVVILFYAHWSQPSKVFKDKLLVLQASQYSTPVIQFASLDCFASTISAPVRDTILQDHSINNYPTTLIFENGIENERVNGCTNAINMIANALMNASPEVTDFQEVLVRLGIQESTIPRHKFQNSMGMMYPDINFRITAVYKVTNPELSRTFQEKQKQLGCPVVEAFHGTKAANVKDICTKNVSMAKAGSTDAGYFGKGLYFSKYADYTFAYAHAGVAENIKPGQPGTVIMFQILLGRQMRVASLTMGADRTAGYDSHVSPKGCEWVIFDNSQCLPVYVFEFEGEPSLISSVGPWEQ